MGGKGRGVFSDFRLGRVRCRVILGESEANIFTVPIPSKRVGWKPAGREEGELVDIRGHCGTDLWNYVYNTTSRQEDIGRRICAECKWIITTFTLARYVPYFHQRRAFPIRLLAPL